MYTRQSARHKSQRHVAPSKAGGTTYNDGDIKRPCLVLKRESMDTWIYTSVVLVPQLIDCVSLGGLIGLCVVVFFFI